MIYDSKLSGKKYLFSPRYLRVTIKEKFSRRLEYIQDTETLTLKLQIFELQQEPNSKTVQKARYISNQMYWHMGESKGWEFRRDFKFMILLHTLLFQISDIWKLVFSVFVLFGNLVFMNDHINHHYRTNNSAYLFKKLKLNPKWFMVELAYIRTFICIYLNYQGL